MNKLEHWFTEAIGAVSGRSFATAHVHEVSEAIPGQRKQLVEFSLECYRKLANMVSAAGELQRVMPTLVVPLNSGSSTMDKGEIALPELKEIFDQDVHEPPIVYLLDRELSKYFEPSEELRRPIRIAHEIGVKGAVVHSYYKCSRSREATETNQEYLRAIWWEAYPEELVL